MRSYFRLGLCFSLLATVNTWPSCASPGDIVVPREVLLFVTEETQRKVPVNRQPLMLQKRFWQPKFKGSSASQAIVWREDGLKSFISNPLSHSLRPTLIEPQVRSQRGVGGELIPQAQEDSSQIPLSDLWPRVEILNLNWKGPHRKRKSLPSPGNSDEAVPGHHSPGTAPLPNWRDASGWDPLSLLQGVDRTLSQKAPWGVGGKKCWCRKSQEWRADCCPCQAQCLATAHGGSPTGHGDRTCAGLSSYDKQTWSVVTQPRGVKCSQVNNCSNQKLSWNQSSQFLMLPENNNSPATPS